MATFYRGTRYVLKGRSTTNALDPTTGRVGDFGNYLSLNSPDHVFDGMPDTAYNPDGYYYGTGGHKFRDQIFSPMKNAGDAAGTAPKSYDYKGVPSAPLAGSTGWSNDPLTWGFFFGLSATQVLPSAQILNAPGQINYYGDYIVKTPMDNPGLQPPTLTTYYDQLQWLGTPSSKAL